jgi:hypothetical protein
MQNTSSPITRRGFLQTIGAGALGVSLSGCATSTVRTTARVKPITGSWISIWWDDRRHVYWNDACLNYSARQWELAVKEVADIGMEYLVLLAVAKGGQAFYDTPLLPKLKMACDDPIEALLSAADKYGVKFFMSSDWYGPWDRKVMLDPERVHKRFQMME